jgi:hypothetical protein
MSLHPSTRLSHPFGTAHDLYSLLRQLAFSATVPATSDDVMALADAAFERVKELVVEMTPSPEEQLAASIAERAHAHAHAHGISGSLPTGISLPGPHDHSHPLEGALGVSHGSPVRVYAGDGRWVSAHAHGPVTHDSSFSTVGFVADPELEREVDSLRVELAAARAEVSRLRERDERGADVGYLTADRRYLTADRRYVGRRRPADRADR